MADRSSDNVTAESVAALAGVSRWTVNRAFKKDASISAKSLKRVHEAAERLGYAPDLLAASLGAERSNLVSLLVDDFSNPHKLVMMERLTRILREHGWATLLVNTLDRNDTSAALLNASQHRVDAAVLIGSQFTDEILTTASGAQRVRKLIVFARSSAVAGTISICCDDTLAMNELTDHVLRRGYRRPMFLAGPRTASAHVLRGETFQSRWRQEYGIEPESICVERYDPQLAYRRVREHLKRLDRGERPDLLVCENDALAFGAIDAIRYELELHVPDDIAVTGFDDVPQAASPHYRLTTFRQPLSAMAEGLVRVLKGEGDVSGLDRFAGQLVIRDSA